VLDMPVRKKKCDGRNLICSACDNRSVPCYGYGPRPDCMDAGEKERKVVEELKSIIKQTSKEKRLHRSGLPTQCISTASFRYGESPQPPVATIPTSSHATEPLSQISLNPYHCDCISAASLPSPFQIPEASPNSSYAGGIGRKLKVVSS
jgi:hypothetical protein